MSTNNDSTAGQTDLAAKDGELQHTLCTSKDKQCDTDMGGPLPQPKRRPRRARADRGLPPDKELASLAQVYLERQRKHWPAVVEAALLPETTEETIGQMVDDFKERHRSGKVDPDTVRMFLKIREGIGIGN